MSNDETEHERERELRNRILESPSLLRGFDGPAAAAKEVPVRRAGSADVVVVNAVGQIGIVECKRAANPQSRRSVIGQVFEYAAGLWKLDYADLKRIFAARGADLTKPFQAVPGWNETTFRRAVSRNLEAGDFRLFVAVDEMTEILEKKLTRTVTFINSQLPQVELLAVVVPRDGGVKVYGLEPEVMPRLEPKLKRDQWTLIEEMGSPAAAAAAEHLFNWADSMKSRGVRVHPTSTQCAIKAPRGPLFRVRSSEVQVSLSAVTKKDEPWDQPTKQLVQDLDEIGVRLGKGNRPRAPLELLAHDPTPAEFLALMERHLETLTD
jgi:hypothetical protein